MHKQIYKIVDTCDIKSGKRLPAGTDFSSLPTEHPYIRARDVKDGKINPDDLVYINDQIYNKIKKYIINTGDIAITIVGASVGDVGYANKDINKYNLTENCVRLTNFREYVNGKYLFYMLYQKQYRDFMQLIAGAAAQPKLGIYKLERIKVALPKIEIQNKIADVLSAYDDLIENNNKRIALLEKAAQELYKEWFVRFCFPGYENVKLKDSALGHIPENFDVVKMGDVLSYYIGGGWGEDDESTSYPCDAYVIRGTDFPKIKNGDWSTCPYRFHKKSNYEARKLEPWDIVLEVSGGTQEQPVGRTLIVTPDLLNALSNKVICASFCKQLRCDDNVISPIYYYYWMQFLYDTRIIDKFQLQSTGIINFKFEYFHRKGDVLLPPKHIMDEFENKVKQIFKLKDDLALQNRNLIKQRDLLLPRLMSGKLEVDVESINKGKETNKIISFEQFKQEFKFAARADNALSDDDVKNLYEAYCNDKCKKE